MKGDGDITLKVTGACKYLATFQAKNLDNKRYEDGKKHWFPRNYEVCFNLQVVLGSEYDYYFFNQTSTVCLERGLFCALLLLLVFTSQNPKLFYYFKVMCSV